MRKILIAAFIILMLVQWFVPGKMIWEKDQVLVQGKAFKFETEPVDPEDPFRGRYIVLNYKADTFDMGSQEYTNATNDVYVSFIENENGYAKIKSVTENEPGNERYFVKATAYRSYGGDNDNKIIITYPFERFYLEEFKAPAAEKAFFDARGDTTQKTYALVSILNGDAVIKNVYVNNKPLVE